MSSVTSTAGNEVEEQIALAEPCCICCKTRLQRAFSHRYQGLRHMIGAIHRDGSYAQDKKPPRSARKHRREKMMPSAVQNHILQYLLHHLIRFAVTLMKLLRAWYMAGPHETTARLRGATMQLPRHGHYYPTTTLPISRGIRQ